MHTGVDIGLKATAIVSLDDNGKFILSQTFGYEKDKKFIEYKHFHVKDRYEKYYQAFDNYFVSNKVTGTVVMEDPAGNFIGNSIKIAELKGVYIVSLFKVPSSKLFFPRAKEIKLFFTGFGNASKEDMIKECFKRGHSPANDHEADAIAMAYMSVEGVLKPQLFP